MEDGDAFVFHAEMYSLTDYFQLKGLQILAKESFYSMFKTVTSKGLTLVIRVGYGVTPESGPLQLWVVYKIFRSERVVLREMLTQVLELAIDLCGAALTAVRQNITFTEDGYW